MRYGRHDTCHDFCNTSAHACVINVVVNWMGKGCIVGDTYLDFNFSLGQEVYSCLVTKADDRIAVSVVRHPYFI